MSFDSRKDGEDGVVYLVNQQTIYRDNRGTSEERSAVTLEVKTVSMRATVMTLNGRPLVLGEGNALPSLEGAEQAAGEVESCSGTY